MSETIGCLTTNEVTKIVSDGLNILKVHRIPWRDSRFVIRGTLDYHTTIDTCLNMIDRFNINVFEDNSYELSLLLECSIGVISRYSIFLNLNDYNEILHLSIYTPHGSISFEPELD